MPNVYIVEIIHNKKIAENVFSTVFACKEIAEEAEAGQFVHIKCGHSRLLRRPISICEVTEGTVHIVFEVKGEGTKWLSSRRPGDKLDILGPLGHGFTYPGGDIIVVGGGIGAPPMLFTAQTAARSGKCAVTAVLGFRSKAGVILQSDFEKVCNDVIITTDDGSAGQRGVVTAPLEKLLVPGSYAAVLSCGPLVMQNAVAELCRCYDVPCQVSLEERMGCGVGACLVCACAVMINGEKQMSRVCADGPVFDAKTVRW